MNRIDFHLLGPEDANILQRVGSGVFDGPIDPRWTSEFLNDPRHYMVVALDEGIVVGMVSAEEFVLYFMPLGD